MEKLLNAIASRLTVRIVVEEQPYETLQGLNITMQIFELRDVTDEVRELFKKELKNHLFTKLQNMRFCESVAYSFDYNKGANDNLAEVLLKLPILNDGEYYVFTSETYIRFTVAKREAENTTIDLSVVSPWIMEACSKQ